VVPDTLSEEDAAPKREPEPPPVKQPPVVPLPRVAAALLLGGGLWGIGSGIWRSSGMQGGQVSVQMPVMILLPFALATLGGWKLWKGRRSGVIIATVLFFAQLIAFRIDGTEFFVRVGTSLWVGLDAEGYIIGTVSAGSSWQLERSGQPGYFAVNLVALACLLVVAPRWRKPREPGDWTS
jgi:hypothetical protein